MLKSSSITLKFPQNCNFIKKRLQYRFFSVKFAKFLKTPCFTEHLQWLLLTVLRFQPVTLLKKEISAKMFFYEFCKIFKNIFSFDRTPADDFFLCLSLNFEKFFRPLLLLSTSGKMLFSCTGCRISTTSNSKKLFRRCFSSIYIRTRSSHSKASI